jgi:ATP-dependent DNA helicase RecG
MKEAMLKENLPEPHFNLQGIFAITLYRPVEFSAWLNTLENKINITQLKLIEIIHNNPKLTNSQMSTELNLSKPAIEKNISKLKDIGLLQRIGSDKEGSYRIIFKSME